MSGSSDNDRAGKVSVPLKHHHLPVFYLKRWAGLDGRLCVFSKPHREIIARRKHPEQTGYEPRLYEMKGVPADSAQTIEQHFMQPVDTHAAEALAKLEKDDDRIRRDATVRSAWSRFIMSLLMRAPEDIAALKAGTLEEWARRVPDMEAKYAALRGPDDPATIEEFLALFAPDETERFAMSLAPAFMDHPKIGEMINHMRWFLVRPPVDAGEFLTSDRPVIMTSTLTEENAYILLPIGPQTLFVAVNDFETERRILAADPQRRVEVVNRFVAAHAVRAVYSRDDTKLDYVRQHMGTQPRSSLMDRLRDLRRSSTPIDTAS